MRDGAYAAMLARRYGTSPAGGQAMVDRLTRTARESGVLLDLERIRPGNTFDAHRLVHLGAARGVQGPVKERLLRGYLCEGVAVGLHEELVPLAVDTGVGPNWMEAK